MTRPTLNADTDTAEMLALVATVTASIAERMDGQERTLEEIRLLGREANAQILDRVPNTRDEIQNLTRQLARAKADLIEARKTLDRVTDGKTFFENLYHKESEEAGTLQRKYTDWRQTVLYAGPMTVLFVAMMTVLYLTPLAARYAYPCTLMAGTWNASQPGYATCTFVTRDD